MARRMAESTVGRGNWSDVRAGAYVSSDRYAILIGDAASQLRRLPAGCVNTCVTSPPYWNARDYGHSDQIGLEPNIEDYVSRLVAVFAEVRRTLTDDGTVWLNVGDTYFAGAGTINGKPPKKGWRRNKQLCLVPYRVALALQEDGWWVRNVACWQKPNAMPSSVRDRLTSVWEPIFLLAKSERYYFDLDAIRVPHETDDQVERKRAERGANNGKAHGKAQLRRWLNSPRHRATIDGLKEVRIRADPPDPTVLAAYLREAMITKGVSLHWVAQELGEPFERTRHYFRTDRIGSRLPPEETWPRLKALLDLGPEFDEAMKIAVKNNVFRNHQNGKNPGDCVSIAAGGGAADHFAVMRPCKKYCVS